MSSEDLLNRRYKLLEQFGKGGMSVVYKAQDLSLGRTVAVKILREDLTDSEEFLARFQQEARAAANLAHPNIVTVHDFGIDGNRYYIVMEHVDGEELKSLIRKSAPFSLDRAIDYAAQICVGVGYAHRAGLVHCDIKPQNILVMSDGRVKVTDFGIARALATIHPEEKNDVVWGSPQYFSPEQAAGEGPTPSSDVYSIGVLLFEMLAGQLPFSAKNPQTLALMHLRDEPPSLIGLNPAVPEAVERIVRKVLSKEPSARYRSADQLGHILTAYRKHGTESTGAHAAVSGSTDPTIVAGGYQEDEMTPFPPLSPADSQPTLSRTPRRYSQSQPTRALPQEEGPDWVAIMLGGVAVLAVLGLIPLWFIVYLRYNPPAPLPIPTPVPASSGLGSIFLGFSWVVNVVVGIIFRM